MSQGDKTLEDGKPLEENIHTLIHCCLRWHLWIYPWYILRTANFGLFAKKRFVSVVGKLLKLAEIDQQY